MWKLIRRSIYVVILLGLVILIVHNVPGRLTNQDKRILAEAFADFEINNKKLESDYKYQLEVIREIQGRSIELINKGHGIPLNTSRELDNALKVGEGECYDRSRFLEKSFRYFDLPARHLSIYVNRDGSRPLKLLASSQTNSHALTEVKTEKGWLIVDSNFEWLALDADGLPLSFEELDEDVSFQSMNPQEGINFYTNENLGVYGLYSRHGRFFKPFNRIPDYNLRELLYNF